MDVSKVVKAQLLPVASQCPKCALNPGIAWTPPNDDTLVMSTIVAVEERDTTHSYP